ncbi:MAG: VPLPA-CTERM sorting domain-containing protein [Pseudomonadota bacterium]
MNKWLLASIYSTPVAALAVAATVNTPNPAMTDFFTNEVKASLLSDLFTEQPDDVASAPEVTETDALRNFKVSRLVETAIAPLPMSTPLELVEAQGLNEAADGPKLVFAKASMTTFKSAVSAISPDGYALATRSLEKDGPRLASPSLKGFSSVGTAASAVATSAGAIGTSSPITLSNELGLTDNPDGVMETMAFKDQFVDDPETNLVAVTAVPLPASLPLIFGGLAIFGLLKRRQLRT